MKKTLFIFAIFLTVFFTSNVKNYISSSSAYPEFWRKYIQRMQEYYYEKYRIKNNQFQDRSAYYRDGTTPNRQPNSLDYGTYHPQKIAEKTRELYNSSNSQNGYMQVGVVLPENNDEIDELTEEFLEIMKISIHNRLKYDIRTFPITATVYQIHFSLLGDIDFIKLYGNLMLEVQGHQFYFNNKGKATVFFQPHELRFTKGDSQSLEVGLRINNPEEIPHFARNLKLRLDDIIFHKEFTSEKIPTRILGQSVSRNIKIDPQSNPQNNSKTSVHTFSSLSGKMIVAGQNQVVLSTQFEAHYDDLYLDKLAITEVLSDGKVSSFISKVEVFDMKTGVILGTTGFVDGKALFRFRNNRIIIPRNESRWLGYRVFTRNNIPNNSMNSRIRFTVKEDDVMVQGIGSGRNLDFIDKNFSLDSETFMIVESTINITNDPVQPELVISNSKNSVHNIIVSAVGQNRLDLARITFEVNLQNLNFPGGMSVDDFELIEMIDGRENDTKTDISISGNKVIFDFKTPYTISKNDSRNFSLKMALEDSNNYNNSDGVIIRVLGDGEFKMANLTEMRAQGHDFIWSDRSAYSHNEKTEDWRNGYLVRNIPTISDGHYRFEY